MLLERRTLVEEEELKEEQKEATWKELEEQMEAPWKALEEEVEPP